MSVRRSAGRRWRGIYMQEEDLIKLIRNFTREQVLQMQASTVYDCYGRVENIVLSLNEKNF